MLMISIGMICVVISTVVAGAVYSVASGTYVPDNAPNIVKYKTYSGNRIVGRTPLATYGNVSSQTCINKCEIDPACMGAVYNQDKSICKTYDANTTSEPDLLDAFDGYDFYEKNYFWSRFSAPQTGSMRDFKDSKLTSSGNTVKDCAIQCLQQNKDPVCRGFNFRQSDGYCKLLSSPLEGNEKYIDTTATDFSFYGVKPPNTNLEDVIIEQDPKNNKNNGIQPTSNKEKFSNIKQPFSKQMPRI